MSATCVVRAECDQLLMKLVRHLAERMGRGWYAAGARRLLLPGKRFPCAISLRRERMLGLPWYFSTSTCSNT